MSAVGGGLGVLCLGINVLDYTVVLDDFPFADTKQVARRQIVSGGGNAANAAVQVSRLGVVSKLLSNVGDDLNGRTLLEFLKKENVNVQGVEIADAGHSVTCFVVVAGKTRTIMSMPYEQRVPNLSIPFLRHQVSDHGIFDNVAVLHLDGRHPEAAIEAAERARSQEQKVSVLVEAELRSSQMMRTQGEEIKRLMSYADIVVTSQDFPTTIASKGGSDGGKPSLVHALIEVVNRFAPLCTRAVVTLGKHGCVAIERVAPGKTGQHTWTTHTVPTFQIAKEVEDTTGAGDAFIGGLAASIARNLPFNSALKIASWTGSMNCRGVGARGGMPKALEMPASIRRLWEGKAECGKSGQK